MQCLPAYNVVFNSLEFDLNIWFWVSSLKGYWDFQLYPFWVKLYEAQKVWTSEAFHAKYSVYINFGSCWSTSLAYFSPGSFGFDSSG